MHFCMLVFHVSGGCVLCGKCGPQREAYSQPLHTYFSPTYILFAKKTNFHIQKTKSHFAHFVGCHINLGFTWISSVANGIFQ